ncbi:hypothetical protein CC1G_12214 [Coprinopsis cinerea okayama7|uniref:Uncharacterized protein n=1 Tax=Coprinopsis cinerea (strain Okayama-7 / 130 / ATCC MYA-4618 / FGSC 9003) TaxID=240176 RepID=A8NKR1_COPC7|nr:hypothetical protein CC1G_12214 [Coprinopsis cinerea okayama7\|eukprot:XP_001834525.2 hypothetical protein CC1G_12214 [Coprinopsis cinerea okayama7\
MARRSTRQSARTAAAEASQPRTVTTLADWDDFPSKATGKPATTTTVNEERHRPSTAKKVKVKRVWNDPLFACGQRLARYIHPFVNVLNFIKIEKKVARFLATKGMNWRALEMSKDRRDHEMYLQVLEMMQNVGVNVFQSSDSTVKNIMFFINKGQSSSWASDELALKTALASWVAPSSEGKAVCGLGFSEEFSLKLLCPVTIDCSREENKVRLQTQRQKLQIGEWPRLLYQNMDYNAADMWDGFLRNSMLLKGGVFLQAAARSGLTSGVSRHTDLST